MFLFKVSDQRSIQSDRAKGSLRAQKQRLPQSAASDYSSSEACDMSNEILESFTV